MFYLILLRNLLILRIFDKCYSKFTFQVNSLILKLDVEQKSLLGDPAKKVCLYHNHFKLLVKIDPFLDKIIAAGGGAGEGDSEMGESSSPLKLAHSQTQVQPHRSVI